MEGVLPKLSEKKSLPRGEGYLKGRRGLLPSRRKGERYPQEKYQAHQGEKSLFPPLLHLPHHAQSHGCHLLKNCKT
jgi:hypothetical protein